ncbi:unnamed protein product [Protopolystoma xenopodis]|uniref:Uncharacterized protein n=1 Tax=Protopolystoma xenopodis TaxID=117903 RepID=A0A448WDW9_9PLAT|nr:unnamed protein product [Protopolystoma xenopodis]
MPSEGRLNGCIRAETVEDRSGHKRKEGLALDIAHDCNFRHFTKPIECHQWRNGVAKAPRRRQQAKMELEAEQTEDTGHLAKIYAKQTARKKMLHRSDRRKRPVRHKRVSFEPGHRLSHSGIQDALSRLHRLLRTTEICKHRTHWIGLPG